MDNSYTSNEFLFSFRGRINRAKYWYAAFASSAFCGVLLGYWRSLWATFGASVKSVHLNLLDIVPFGDAGPASTETLTSLLFDAAGTPIVVFGTRFLGATTVKRLHDRNKSPGGWSRCSSHRTSSIDFRIGLPILMRWPSSVLSHPFFAAGALSNCSV